jgi:hypothetical protein
VAAASGRRGGERGGGSCGSSADVRETDRDGGCRGGGMASPCARPRLLLNR